MAGHTVVLGGTSYGPGRHHLSLPVTTDLDGNDIRLHLHLVVGERPGKTLTVVAGQHGLEWMPIETLRRVLDGLDPSTMSGAFLALPVANPPTLGILRRNTPDDSDNADLNRVYPGHETWIAEQIASTIVREILPATSALIDFHWGIWGSCMGEMTYGADFPDAEVVATSRAMALAFGHPTVRAAKVCSVSPGPKSLVGYAGAVLGIPSMIGNVGGAGFAPDREEAWLELEADGLLSVMRLLDILPGEPKRLGRYLVSSSVVRVNPSVGGLFYPQRDPEAFARRVEKGEVLGRVMSPYTLETLETLTAPCAGFLLYFARWYPVRPGDWTFAVIPEDHPDTAWIES